MLWCTPEINSRLPRSAANNSMASGMRVAAPVSTTMPSALLSSVTSSVAIWPTNQKKPASASTTAAAPANMVVMPIQRATAANI